MIFLARAPKLMFFQSSHKNMPKIIKFSMSTKFISKFMPIIIKFSCPKSFKFDAFLREQENDEKIEEGKERKP
jgi:hypothetical protein